MPQTGSFGIEVSFSWVMMQCGFQVRSQDELQYRMDTELA
jgi:hypothetical protein